MAAVRVDSRPRRASLYTLGCRLNQSETALLADRLRAAGYAIVPFGEDADLGIINTCTVTNEADSKSRQVVRQFVRKNPEAYTAVIGCYSQMGYKALSAIDGVDLIVGNQEKLNVLDYVDQGKNVSPLIVRDRIERDDFTIEFDGAGAVDRRANLKVQDGCDFMCSFCIIPFARGRARSRALPNLLDEARSLAERGAREIVLTGVNIGTYDWEGRGLVEVVDALNAIPGVERIRISSIEPTTIADALLDRMADPGHALVPYLHIPLQSGSNAILQRMRRRYSRADYADFVNQAAERVPGIGIGTDVLVGMPGETNADFADTLAMLQDTPLFYAHVFKYSERSGTASARMDGKIAPEVIHARAAAVRKLSAEKRAAFGAAQVGQTVEVLFERSEPGFPAGYAPNFLRVAVEHGGDLTNQTRPVMLEAVCGDFTVGRLADGP